MELLPQNQVYFDTMVEKLRRAYMLYGFTALDTPVIESAEVLLAKGGGETEKQIYRVTKGETEHALRFDLTVPLAKYVAANYGQLTFPFRRFQIGKVYRGERAQRGRFREFYQADIDIIGDGTLGIINEAEIPGVIYHSLTSLGLDDFVIHINNRKILAGLFEILGLSAASADIMRSIDKLDKIGADKVRELLTDDFGVGESQAAELLALINSSDGLKSLDAYKGKSEVFDRGADELAVVVRHMSEFGVPESHFTVDLKIARGLDYYTGTVYETILTKHPGIGSICSGGRYDDLAEYYTYKKLPGVGISIGLTRLFFVLDDQGLLTPELPSAPADVLIIPMTGDFAPAVTLATAMREAGIRTQLYSEDKKFKAKMSYADKLGVPFVVFLGEDEINAGKITVKNMKTGEQVTANAGLLIQGIKEKIDAAKSAKPIKEL
jgi:histidyl-tRNA synthetase